MAHSRHSVKICQVNEEERGREVGKETGGWAAWVNRMEVYAWGLVERMGCQPGLGEAEEVLGERRSPEGR